MRQKKCATSTSPTAATRPRPTRNDPLPHLALEQIALEQLRTAPRRVRRGSKAHVAKVRRSIERFGCVRPLLVAREGEVVDGHAILEALRDLGASTAPCVRIDHLSEVEIRQLRIAVNRLQEQGTWDDDALKIEFEDLLEVGVDLTVTGFELPELDLIIGDKGGEEDPLDAAACPGERDGPAVSEKGDLWDLGGHRVICASARDKNAAARLMGDETAATVFTDPPYNVPVTGHIRTRSGFDEFAEAAGEMAPAEFEDFLSEALGVALTRLAPDGLLYVFMDWRHARELDRAFDRLGLEQVNLCVWIKPTGGMGSLYRSRHELVFVAGRKGRRRRNNVQLGRFGRDRTNVWEYAGATGGARSRGDDDFSIHPTVKPVRLVADALLDASALGEIVFDPFLGSGTTLLAAERTRRRCIGMEIEPAYVDLAIRRWRDMTGLDAVHAETGETFTQREAHIAATSESRNQESKAGAAFEDGREEY